MDYKKLYEKAVERAKTLTNSGFNDFDFVKHIFPELKESKDDMVRKAIIEHFEGSHSSMYPYKGFTKEQILAWLEKQGEKLPVGFYYVNSEGKKFYSDTFKYGDVILHVEKQGEQKSAEFKPLFRVGDVIKPKDPVLGEPRIIKGIHPKFGYDTNNGTLDFEFEDNWELVEQKPANKVEPKFKVKYADSEYNVLEVKDIAGVTFYGIEDEPNHIDYVKAENCEIISGYGFKESGLSFPTKPVMFSEQKSAWSEEDGKNLEKAIWYIEKGGKLIFEKTDKLVSWLKSLKERYTWKPSDEQMKALADALSLAKNCGEEIAFDLRTLYEQLKKLKG